MLTFTTGNLLEAPTMALVNTVNTVGVMGKGIALQFKEQFPENYKVYQKACKEKKFDIGKLLIVKELTLQGEKTIVNFPTKRDWKHRSTYAYVENGLKALVEELEKGEIQSIAIPPLGCGNGGLKWEKVKVLIHEYLGHLRGVEIVIYEPNEAIKAQLQATEKKPIATLTPARAMLLHAMFEYEMSMGESVNLFVANKLAYFLQRIGEPLKLNFQQAPFGPFTPQVGHVLYALNGTYLNGLEQNEAKAFESLHLNYSQYANIKHEIKHNLSFEQKERLSALQRLITGFESFFSLEVLATVDYLTKDDPNKSLAQIMTDIAAWSPRKAANISERYVEIALKRLSAYREQVFV